MTRRAQAAFSLLEMMIALALLGLLLVLVYASLQTGVRAWDSGDARASEASHQRIVAAFLRRELEQVFPVRWRGTTEPRIAFEGEKGALRFVTSLNLGAGYHDGGLQWAEIYLADDTTSEGRHRALFIRREPFDLKAKDWEGLSAAKPVRLIKDVQAVELSYFGAESDVAEPKWSDEWKQPQRLPLLIRIAVRSESGRPLPDLVVAPKLGEEAGCYDSGFQRVCAPRKA